MGAANSAGCASSWLYPTASLRTTRFGGCSCGSTRTAFEVCFTAWVGALATPATPAEPEVVAVDGKTLRRSLDRDRNLAALHVVSAWACEQHLVLGQRRVDGESNEITAIPELLQMLALENALVTLDAMGCQKDIARHILDRRADYLLVLKANQGNAYAAVRSYSDTHCFQRNAAVRPVLMAAVRSRPRSATSSPASLAILSD